MRQSASKSTWSIINTQQNSFWDDCGLANLQPEPQDMVQRAVKHDVKRGRAGLVSALAAWELMFALLPPVTSVKGWPELTP